VSAHRVCKSVMCYVKCCNLLDNVIKESFYVIDLLSVWGGEGGCCLHPGRSS